MLSILKVQSPNNICRPLRLTVSPLLGLEASIALIYNGLIQRQSPWYLLIPPPRAMIMIHCQWQTELQVRGKFWCLCKLALTRCFLIFQKLEDHNLWKWVRLAIRAQAIGFMLTSKYLSKDFTFLCRWTRIPSHHNTDQDSEELVHICL